MKKAYLDALNGRPIKITKWDMHPINFNRETMLNWLVDSGWIDSYIANKVGKDKTYYEDYRLEIWVLIIQLADRLVDVFNYEGKGKFTNFLKMVMNNNIDSKTSPAYRHIRRDPETRQVFFNDEGWLTIDQTYDYESGLTYSTINYTAENPFDDLCLLDNEKLIEYAYGKKKVQ